MHSAPATTMRTVNTRYVGSTNRISGRGRRGGQNYGRANRQGRGSHHGVHQGGRSFHHNLSLGIRISDEVLAAVP
jgi:hypothetical protein